MRGRCDDGGETRGQTLRVSHGPHGAGHPGTESDGPARAAFSGERLAPVCLLPKETPPDGHRAVPPSVRALPLPSLPMTLLVAGAHGAIGQHVVQILAEAGHHVLALIRDADQSALLRTLGGHPIVGDLTGDVSDAPSGCDAVVFAAGSGGEAVEAVDRDGAIQLIDAAVTHGVRRFVMLSSIGADAPEEADQLQDYLRAKHEADQHLLDSGLTYTILRPTTLTNGAGVGTATFAASLDLKEGSSEVAREDVAAALAAIVTISETEHAVIEMTAGPTPIREGLAAT